MDNIFGDIMRNIFFVTDEGGIVEQRVVYELPYRTISITLPSFSELLEKSNLIWQFRQ